MSERSAMNNARSPDRGKTWTIKAPQAFESEKYLWKSREYFPPCHGPVRYLELTIGETMIAHHWK